jgi:hypothetical protein
MDKILKVSQSSTKKSYVPGIKLAGKYLEEFNFFLNDYVFVTCSKNKIILQKATKKQLIQRMSTKNPDLSHLISELNLI